MIIIPLRPTTTLMPAMLLLMICPVVMSWASRQNRLVKSTPALVVLCVLKDLHISSKEVLLRAMSRPTPGTRTCLTDP